MSLAYRNTSLGHHPYYAHHILRKRRDESLSRFTSGLNFRLFTMCAFLWLRNAIYRNWAVAGVRCGVLLCLHVFASVALLPSRTKHSARAYPSITCSYMGIMPLGSHNHSCSIPAKKNHAHKHFRNMCGNTCWATHTQLTHDDDEAANSSKNQCTLSVSRHVYRVLSCSMMWQWQYIYNWA